MYDNFSYEKRINSYTTIKFPFYVHNSNTRLFMVLNLKTISKLGSIQKQLGKIKLISLKNTKLSNPIYKHYTQMFFIVQLVDNNVNQPIIFSKSTQSHPLEIFLVILIAGMISGIVGMIIAVPFYTMVKVLAKAFFPENKLVQVFTRKI